MPEYEAFQSMGRSAARWMEGGNTIAHLLGPDILQTHAWRPLAPYLDKLIGMVPDEVLHPKITGINIKFPGSSGFVTSESPERAQQQAELYPAGGILGRMTGFSGTPRERVSMLAKLLGLDIGPLKS